MERNREILPLSEKKQIKVKIKTVHEYDYILKFKNFQVSIINILK